MHPTQFFQPDLKRQLHLLHGFLVFFLTLQGQGQPFPAIRNVRMLGSYYGEFALDAEQEGFFRLLEPVLGLIHEGQVGLHGQYVGVLRPDGRQK